MTNLSNLIMYLQELSLAKIFENQLLFLVVKIKITD